MSKMIVVDVVDGEPVIEHEMDDQEERDTERMLDPYDCGCDEGCDCDCDCHDRNYL